MEKVYNKFLLFFTIIIICTLNYFNCAPLFYSLFFVFIAINTSFFIIKYGCDLPFIFSILLFLPGIIFSSQPELLSNQVIEKFIACEIFYISSVIFYRYNIKKQSYNILITILFILTLFGFYQLFIGMPLMKNFYTINPQLIPDQLSSPLNKELLMRRLGAEPYGNTANPNIFSFLLLPLGIFSLFTIIKGKKIFIRTSLLILPLVMLFINSSKTAVAGLLLYLPILYFYKNKKFKILLILLSVLPLFILLTPSSKRPLNTVSSVETRYEYLDVSKDIIINKSFQPSGAGKWYKEYLTRMPYGYEITKSAHNFMIETAVENGFFSGLMVLLILVALIIRKPVVNSLKYNYLSKKSRIIFSLFFLFFTGFTSPLPFFSFYHQLFFTIIFSVVIYFLLPLFENFNQKKDLTLLYVQTALILLFSANVSIAYQKTGTLFIIALFLSFAFPSRNFIIRNIYLNFIIFLFSLFILFLSLFLFSFEIPDNLKNKLPDNITSRDYKYCVKKFHSAINNNESLNNIIIRDEYRQLLKKFTNDFQLLLIPAKYFILNKDKIWSKEETILYLDKAQQLFPANRKILYLKARVFEKALELDKATIIYNDIKKLKINSKSYVINLSEAEQKHINNFIKKSDSTI